MKKNNVLMIIICVIIFGFKTNKQIISSENSSVTDTIKTISGTFNSYFFTHIDALGNSSIDSLNIVEFYPSAIDSQFTSKVYAGIVTLNSKEILFNNTYLSYFQNDGSSIENKSKNPNEINMRNLNWNVAGSSAITPFSFSLTPVYPDFNPDNLPDTCTKSTGITLTLNMLSNTDPTMFISTATLMQDNGTIQTTKTINFSAININTVFFSSSDLSAFNANSNIDIIISLQNYKYVSIGSQNYAYITSRHYKKDGFLK